MKVRFLFIISILLTFSLFLHGCGKIKISNDYNTYSWKYNEAQAEFLKLGFKNVKLEPVYDIIFGIFVKHGDVDEITINDQIPKIGDKFNADDQVRIKYHSDHSDEPEEEKITKMSGTYASELGTVISIENNSGIFYDRKKDIIDKDIKITIEGEKYCIEIPSCGSKLYTTYYYSVGTNFIFKDKNQKREDEEFIRKSDKSLGEDEQKFAELATSKDTYKDLKFEDLYSLLKKEGFNNIKLEPEYFDDWSLFTIEGYVKEISINGVKNFNSYLEFPKNSKVIIKFETNIKNMPIFEPERAKREQEEKELRAKREEESRRQEEQIKESNKQKKKEIENFYLENEVYVMAGKDMTSYYWFNLKDKIIHFLNVDNLTKELVNKTSSRLYGDFKNGIAGVDADIDDNGNVIEEWYDIYLQISDVEILLYGFDNYKYRLRKCIGSEQIDLKSLIENNFGTEKNLKEVLEKDEIKYKKIVDDFKEKHAGELLKYDEKHKKWINKDCSMGYVNLVKMVKNRCLYPSTFKEKNHEYYELYLESDIVDANKLISSYGSNIKAEAGDQLVVIEFTSESKAGLTIKGKAVGLQSYKNKNVYLIGMG